MAGDAPDDGDPGRENLDPRFLSLAEEFQRLQKLRPPKANGPLPELGPGRPDPWPDDERPGASAPPPPEQQWSWWFHEITPVLDANDFVQRLLLANTIAV